MPLIRKDQWDQLAESIVFKDDAFRRALEALDDGALAEALAAALRTSAERHRAAELTELTATRPWLIIAADARKALERGDIALAERLATNAEKLKTAIEQGGTHDNPNPLIRTLYPRKPP